MDDCPTFFAVPLPAAPIPEPTGPLWFYRDPDLCGALTFDEFMDTTVEPKPEQLQFRVDTVVSDADAFEWGTDVMAQSNVTLPGLTPADVNMILPVEQNKYRTALGATVPVYDLAAFHVIPTPVAGQFFANARMLVNFNLVMDTSDTPPDANWEIKLDGVPASIINQSWSGSTQLSIIIDGLPTSGTVISANFFQASNNMRSNTGRVMCPFFVEDTIP